MLYLKQAIQASRKLSLLNINCDLLGKTRLNENSIVLHFQCTLNALIMHYNTSIMVLNAFAILLSPL